MDYVWSPWRFRYVSSSRAGDSCPFCYLIQQDTSHDRENYILRRARRNFVFLNLFPYTTGHLLVAPYEHKARLAELDEETLQEMMLLARQAEIALQSAYQAEGYNAGLNLGRCAGAGVADHLHLHFLPRWTGDTNFMSVVSETRVLPEDLQTTYGKLERLFQP